MTTKEYRSQKKSAGSVSGVATVNINNWNVRPIQISIHTVTTGTGTATVTVNIPDVDEAQSVVDGTSDLSSATAVRTWTIDAFVDEVIVTSSSSSDVFTVLVVA